MTTCPVADVRLFALLTPRRTGSVSSHVLVRLTSADGAVGWGELSDLDCYRMFMPDLGALHAAVTRVVIGYDAHNLTELHRRLGALLPDYRHCARTYPPFSLESQLAAAIEMACLDLSGRALGRSVSELLGGGGRATLPVAYPLFSSSIDRSGAVDEFAPVEFALSRGVSIFRYYVGPDDDASRTFLHTLVDRYRGRVTLKALDFGSRFHWKSVLRFLRSLDGVEPALVESASWREDYNGLAQLRRAIDVDVCEHVSCTSQLLRMIRAEAIDVANITIQSGGLYPARQLFDLAHAAGINCLLGTTQELSLGTSAGAHLAATVADVAHPADTVGPLLYTVDPAVTPVHFEHGELVVPTGPGLGIEIDEARLDQLAGDLVDWEHPAHGEHYAAR